MKKKFTGALAAVMMISCLIPSAYAQYHPTVTLTVSETGASNVTAHSTLYYTATQINDIRELNNLENYVAVEHRSDPGKTTSMGIPSDSNYYTTLPNPAYDRDDDKGDGWWEESEITILGTMTANKSYVFSSFYQKATTVRGGVVNFNSQRSYRLISREYNTVPGSSKTLKYVYWGTSARTMPITSDYDGESENERMSLMLSENVNSKTELDQMVQNKYTAFDNFFVRPSTYSYGSQSIEGMITFNTPIYMAELETILEESGAELVSYQAKFYNTEGDWCTFGGNSTDEQEMIRSANEASEYYGAPHVSYEGIVCAEVVFEQNLEAYQAIKESPSVYFLDISKTLWEANNDLGQNAKIMVPSYAWDLAAFTD